jgi:hypothetical protein
VFRYDIPWQGNIGHLVRAHCGDSSLIDRLGAVVTANLKEPESQHKS